MKRAFISFLVSAVLLLQPPGLLKAAIPPESMASITGYQAIFRPVFTRAGEVRLATRRFTSGAADYWLTVHPASFETELLPQEELDLARQPAERSWRRTPYLKALSKHNAAPFLLFNDGITRADHPIPGFFFTIDLCPSSRPLEKQLLENLARLPQSRKGPVPVGVAVSGLWAVQHPDDVEWLQAQTSAGKLAITWINHSYSHPYDSTQPNNRTFLLTPGVDLNAEILVAERLMLERGLLPSPFFRFPGLISDRNAMQTLCRLGLIAIGSDTWLGLGETPQPGSIMLIHGMGSATEDMGQALSFFDHFQKEFNNGSLILLPLPKAFSGTALKTP